MPFESCPTCGYALSVHGHLCRHCLPSGSGFAKAGPLFSAKHLPQVIVTAVVLSLLAYLMFFR